MQATAHKAGYTIRTPAALPEHRAVGARVPPLKFAPSAALQSHGTARNNRNITRQQLTLQDWRPGTIRTDDPDDRRSARRKEHAGHFGSRGDDGTVDTGGGKLALSCGASADLVAVVAVMAACLSCLLTLPATFPTLFSPAAWLFAKQSLAGTEESTCWLQAKVATSLALASAASPKRRQQLPT